MTLVFEPEVVPLATDATGVIRVGGTRVTLETVIGAFRDGATAEEIILDYPVLGLAEVYSVIGYYLRHREAVEDYLRQAEDHAAAVRQEINSRFPPTGGLRERLLARRASGQS